MSDTPDYKDMTDDERKRFTRYLYPDHYFTEEVVDYTIESLEACIRHTPTHLKPQGYYEITFEWKEFTQIRKRQAVCSDPECQRERDRRTARRYKKSQRQETKT